MKLTIIISILLTTYLNAATQIVIGTFSKSSSAVNTKDELSKVINNNTKLKTLIEKNNIKAVTKEDGKYFLVTLEPILNKTTQTQLLNKIKSTKFKDAYILKLELPKVELPNEIKEKEKSVKNLEVKTVETTKKTEVKKVEAKEVKPEEITPVVVKEKEVKKEVKKPIQPVKRNESSFIEEYLMEIIAAIAILVLIVIYLFILKNKQKKYQDEDDVIIIDHDKENVDAYGSDIENIEEVPQEEPSSFEVNDEEAIPFEQEPEDVPKAEETSKESNDLLKSSIEKKEVPDHGKITKEDFKEFEGIRVMIAEDNLINQKVIKGLLSESGIQLTIVDDGQEVIDHLKEDDAYCLILMDVNMPNMDGYEATKIIRQNPDYSHITVVALSGDIAADDIANMRASGMQENLEKPLSMDSLYDILYSYGYHREDKIDIQSSNSEEASSNELDIQTGIEVCGGDEEFYKEILRDFVNNYDGSTGKIQNYLNNNDIDSAQKILLDIMGLTANIGANNLQKILKKLKEDLKDTQDKKYIETFKEYAQHFEALEKEVKEYIS